MKMLIQGFIGSAVILMKISFESIFFICVFRWVRFMWRIWSFPLWLLRSLCFSLDLVITSRTMCWRSQQIDIHWEDRMLVGLWIRSRTSSRRPLSLLPLRKCLRWSLSRLLAIPIQLIFITVQNKLEWISILLFFSFLLF